MRSRAKILSLIAFASAAAGCGGGDALDDEAYGVMDLAPYYADGAAPNNPAVNIASLAPVRGYSQGDDADFYDLGLVPFVRTVQDGAPVPTVAPTNPMYFFFDARGNPLFAQPVRDERTALWVMPGGDPTVSPNQAPGADRTLPHSIRPRQIIVDPRRASAAHQRPIVDIGPEGLVTRYTGLWEIVEITAPDGYAPDVIKSWATLSRAISGGTFSARSTGRVIDCPMVDERTAIVAPTGGRDVPQPVIELWYRRKLGFCLLAHGWETLARDGTLIPSGRDGARLQTFDVVRAKVQVGQEDQDQLLVPATKLFVPAATVGRTDVRFGANLIAEERPRHTEADPPGYTPIRWLWDAMVDAKFTPGTMKTMVGVDAKTLRPRPAGPWVKNVALSGVVPTCGTRDATTSMWTADAEDRCAAAALSCNRASCSCDIPAVGWGEMCAPGFQRCRTEPLDAAEAAFAPAGYVCQPAAPRGFCVPRCDATATDTSPEADRDSRCGDVPGFACMKPGACMRPCKPGDAGDRACRAPLRVTLPGRDGADREIDAAAGLRCLSQGGVAGCNFDDALYP